MTMTAGFVGYECGDIVIYLAKMLSALGKRTVILDRTGQRIISGMCGAEEEYAGIRLSSLPEEILEQEWDIILKVFAYQPLWKEMRECKELFLVTDGSAFRARLLAEAEIASRNCCMIIRDMVPMKYGQEYLMLLSGQEIERCFLLPLEKRDVRNRYRLGTERNVLLRQLSEDMREFLSELTLRLLPSIEQKQIRLAEKRYRKERADTWEVPLYSGHRYGDVPE